MDADKIAKALEKFGIRPLGFLLIATGLGEVALPPDGEIMKWLAENIFHHSSDPYLGLTILAVGVFCILGGEISLWAQESRKTQRAVEKDVMGELGSAVTELKLIRRAIVDLKTD